MDQENFFVGERMWREVTLEKRDRRKGLENDWMRPEGDHSIEDIFQFATEMISTRKNWKKLMDRSFWILKI